MRVCSIHEYNTDFTILTFLPYHATPLFPTLLSMLPRQLSATYRFLYPYMTSLANPSRQAIVYTAINTVSFFNALNQYVLRLAKARHHSTGLLSFWASVAIQAINGMLDAARSGRDNIQRQREEDLLLRVMPVLNDALILRISELTLACCMIMTVLATKADLEDKILNGMMEAIVASWTIEILDDCLVCLAVMAQERQAVKLPKAVLRKLLKVEGLGPRLIALSQQCRVEKLALGCILGAFERSGNSDPHELFNMIESMLQSGILNRPQTATVIKSLLLVIGRLDQDPYASAEHRSQLGDLVGRLNESATIGETLRSVIEEQNLDVEMLEVKLKTVLRPAIKAEPSAQDDTAMTDDAKSLSMEPFDTLLSAIPTRTVTEVSFLCSSTSTLLDDLSKVYLQAVASKEDLEKFASLSILHQTLDPELFLTFYLRMWCGPYPALARNVALQMVSKMLSGLEPGSVDLQALIPYVLFALGDSSGTVRRAAAECATHLSRLSSRPKSAPNGKPIQGAELSESESESDSEDSSEDDKSAVTRKATGRRNGSAQAIKIWGHNTLYGTLTKSVHWLSNAEAHKFFSVVIIPALEACILDAHHIGNILDVALNGAVRSGRLGQQVGAPELGSSLKATVCGFLSSHVVNTPLLAVRLRLLSMLNRVEKSGSAARKDVLLPALRRWIAISVNEAASMCEAEGVELRQLDHEYLGTITSREQDGLHLLRNMLGDSEGSEHGIQHAAFQRLRVIWPSLKAAARQSLAQCLLDLSLMTSDDEAVQVRREEALDTLRSLPLSCVVFASFINGLPDAAQMADKPPDAKRRRTSRSEMARQNAQDSLDITAALRKYTLVLELVESSAPENHPELLKGLFRILGELQHFRAQTESGLVYLQSLTIGCLLSIVDKLKDKKEFQIDKAVIRVDLLVDCVRNTSSPQIQNSALLLISSLASWVPEVVLHSVMPIFTFMSTSLLRQSDDYSAHVIDRTISRVVPPLAASLRKKNRDLVAGASELLLSFTAAFEHIPLHRRLGLFIQLTRTLGADDCLYAIIALLVDRHPNDNHVRQFVAELMASFDARTQLGALARYMNFVQTITMPSRAGVFDVLSINERSAADREITLVSLLEALAALMDNQQLRTKLAKAVRADPNDASTLQGLFSELLRLNISISQQAKDRKAVHDACGHLMINSLKLLPTADLIKSAETLLEHDDIDVQRNVLSSLEAQISRVKQNDEASRTALLGFVPRVTAIIQQTSDTTLKHTAVTCIDRITERFGKVDTASIAAAARIVASEACLGDADNRLRIISLLCLASIVEVLQDEIIPLLPQLMPTVFDYLRQSVEVGPRMERIHNASYALVSSVVEHVPYMFSGHYLDTALQLSHQSALMHGGDDWYESRLQFYQFAARKIEIREYFAAMERNVEDAIRSGYPALSEHINMVNAALDRQAKPAVVKNSQTLFNLFLKAFDLRRLREAENLGDRYDIAQLDEMEALLNNVAISMVMKLNDAAFRPFFLRFVDWAFKSLPKRDAKGKALRSITLFVFLRTFFDRLKSIVTSYSSYILDQAADILRSTRPDTPEGQALVKSVLQALFKSFEHDQDDFWQAPSHFSAISDPLLGQLTQATGSSLSDDVIPTITELAAAAASSDHHREMNAMILRHMRSDDAHVRLAAVKCEQSLTERLGEDWLGLLPEMLPFISELQEDDDEDVERETQRWIKRIEEILGESLDAMLQ